MSDVTARLNALKAQIEQGKTEKAKAEANMEVYTKQKEELVKQLADLGVTPETLDSEIAKLDQEIAAGLDQAEALLKG
jgi:chromosome segregation ATPase